MKLLGIDPGLRRTGWGVIETVGNRLSYIAGGVVLSDAKRAMADRLAQLFEGLTEVIELHRPNEVAVEETYVNMNARSTLALGQARGIALLVPAQKGLVVAEYAPNLIKKSVVGAGHADKEQVQMMVQMLLPGCQPDSADTADALAVAICHAHHATGLAERVVAAEARA